MKLINTDGMAFIGPGSEWFWSMAQFVLVAVTLIGIYYQLRLQSSANAFEQINAVVRESTSERMTRYKLDVLVALRDGVDPAHVPDAAAFALGNFWEVFAGLARRRHLDPKVVRESSGVDCVTWWDELAPYVHRRRAEWQRQTMFEDFEWLAGVLAESVRPFDAAWHAQLEARIAYLRDVLRVEEALRSVTVAAPAAPTVGQPEPVPTPAQAPTDT